MTNYRKLSAVGVAVLTVSAWTTPVHAGFTNTLTRGFQLVGFSTFGDNNALTAGREFLATNTFSGNPIDFGPWSLTLQGPLSTGFSVANRPFQGFDFSFGTAASGSRNASPLTYSLNFDLGGQTASLSGSLLLDGNAHVDRLGFYSVRFNASSRSTLTGTGDNTNEADFDLGPMDISGNIFIDAIAALTAPLFDAANVVNPFDSLTARSQIQAIVDTQTSDLLELLRNGVTPGDSTAQRGISFALNHQADNGTLSNPTGVTAGAGVVPEPTVLLLMLAGLPFVVRRKA